MVGLLSRSYRRRAKVFAPSTDTRYVTLKESRGLTTSDSIDNDNHSLTMHLQSSINTIGTYQEEFYPHRQNLPSGRRREAVGGRNHRYGRIVYRMPVTAFLYDLLRIYLNQW